MVEFLELGAGLAFAGLFTGMVAVLGISIYMDGKKEIAKVGLERARVERGYNPQERNIILGNEPERFIEVNGEVFYSKIDGQRLEDTLGEQ